MSQLKLNIIPFEHPAQEMTFGFKSARQKGFFPLNADEFPSVLQEKLNGQNIDRLYGTDKEINDPEFTITIKPEESPQFVKHHYSQLVFNYFIGRAKVVAKNFVGDTEVWFHHRSKSTRQYWAFKRFTVKVQIARITNTPELLISYDGISSVLKKNVASLYDVPPEYIKNVVYKGRVYDFRNPFPWLKEHIEELYPKLNNNLKKHLNIEIKIQKIKNRFKPYWKEITWLLEKHIDTEEFKQVIPIASNQFLQYPLEKALNTTEKSNEILFGGGQTGIVPKINFGTFGPYQPTTIHNVRLLFIYHSEDKAKEVTKLYKALVNGVISGRYTLKPINEFIKQNLYLPDSGNIEIQNPDNAIEEVRAAIKKLDFTDGRKYIAIYIAPQSKDSLTHYKPNFYYQLKEELLYSGISSQVILKDTINDTSGFIWSMNNIGIAILAKMGGIPWRLNRLINDELIVGVGAFISLSRKTNYVGNAFCFNNKGVFKDFNCFRSDDLDALAASIRKAIMKYKIDYGETAKRLVIHFYKKMSEQELEPIITMLHEFNWQIPVIIITINKTESNDYVGFDTSVDHLMPQSGTIMPIGKNQYLLFNNTWYNRNLKAGEFHFPVKLTFSSTHPQAIEDKEVIQELIDQVYQFSRMYWKSVKQQNLPVTIKYPEMAAELFSYFEKDTLPEFGRQNLWFL